MARTMTRRAQALVAAGAIAVVVVVVALAAGDEPDRAAVETAEAPGATAVPAVPPDDFSLFDREFGAALEGLGLRLTRAGLQAVPGDYAAAGEPRHLALYVEPLSASFTTEEFLGSLVGSAQVFLPAVFERWPGLVSMDVCQEPPPGLDDQTAPPPVTVLEMTGESAAGVEWETIDLAGLIAAADEGLVDLFAAPALRSHDQWKAARAVARS